MKLAEVRTYLRDRDNLFLIDTEIGELEDMQLRAQERKGNNENYSIALLEYSRTGATTL